MASEPITGHCVLHPFEGSIDVCDHCGIEYCSGCLVHPFGVRKPPMCVKCALSASGVRSTARAGKRASGRAVRKRREQLQALRAERLEAERRSVPARPVDVVRQQPVPPAPAPSIRFGPDGSSVDATGELAVARWDDEPPPTPFAAGWEATLEARTHPVNHEDLAPGMPAAADPPRGAEVEGFATDPEPDLGSDAVGFDLAEWGDAGAEPDFEAVWDTPSAPPERGADSAVAPGPVWEPAGATPVWEPTDTPVWEPTDTPVWTPTDTPAWTPTDTPAWTPTDTPAWTPTDTPVWEPAAVGAEPDPWSWATEPAPATPSGIAAAPAEGLTPWVPPAVQTESPAPTGWDTRTQLAPAAPMAEGPRAWSFDGAGPGHPVDPLAQLSGPR